MLYHHLERICIFICLRGRLEKPPSRKLSQAIPSSLLGTQKVTLKYEAALTANKLEKNLLVM